MTRISLGIPYYGRADAEWWANLVAKVGLFPKMGLEFGGLHVIGAMLTDKNRNTIADDFLKTDGEWLFWIDADTTIPHGAINRLLDLDKTMASGLYYGKGEGHIPIAYVREPATGAYRSLEKVLTWERGEIVPVDACGFGCMLTHRSVFEDIKKNYTVLQRVGAGITTIHNDDITGDVPINKRSPQDGKVINGQERVRLMPPTIDNPLFPFFILEYNRTEDMKFFEIADRVGHKPWLDTSIECGHIRPHPVKGEDYREAMLHKRIKEASSVSS